MVLTKSEDIHILAFHQGLHCLQLPRTVVHINLESLPCDPLICTMNHPRLIVSNQMEEFSTIQRV